MIFHCLSGQSTLMSVHLERRAGEGSPSANDEAAESSASFWRSRKAHMMTAEVSLRLNEEELVLKSLTRSQEKLNLIQRNYLVH